MIFIPLIWLASAALCLWVIYTHGNPESFTLQEYVAIVVLAPPIVLLALVDCLIEGFRK
jgi:hypothetical protein